MDCEKRLSWWEVCCYELLAFVSYGFDQALNVVLEVKIHCDLDAEVRVRLIRGKDGDCFVVYL